MLILFINIYWNRLKIGPGHGPRTWEKNWPSKKLTSWKNETSRTVNFPIYLNWCENWYKQLWCPMLGFRANNVWKVHEKFFYSDNCKVGTKNRSYQSVALISKKPFCMFIDFNAVSFSIKNFFVFWN